MTNGDRIRKMSDEELAKFLIPITTLRCTNCPVYEKCTGFVTCYEMLTGWLKQVAKDE